ncbi:MAG: M23 family metallopeptidase [Oscillospiraceae bacterium]|nr:M23 family metallopeptidase [Oscillospiraceae bacterium]
MSYRSPLKKLLRCTAALLIALAAVLPAVSAGAQNLPSDTAPMTGRRSFDLLGSSELHEAEVTISLEEIKAREDDSEEYVPHVWPVRFSDHGYISSYFGTRIDPVTGEGLAFHGGIDLADKPGTKIHASASGVVVDAYESEGFGLNILIDHGNGYQTRYSHCNSMLVEEGDTVKQGQVIATMGATGRVTGVHLDFRVYLDGEAIDPLLLLDEQ